MTTASGTLQDRRQRAAARRDSMAAANKDDRHAARRNLAAQCLGLSAVDRPAFAVKDDNRPGAAGEADVWAQTLFNRLLFVHFVSRKGWLTYGGNADYLNALWADYQANPAQTNCYAGRLDSLFHGGMNTPEPERDPGIAGIIGTVRFGIKTGANNFFYLTPERIKEFGIEIEFLAPVMPSPTESRSIIVEPATLPYQIFLCHKDKADLKGVSALRYIEWAERNHQWHTSPSTRGRRNWYDLGARTPPPIAVHRITDERTRAFRSDGQTHYGNTLYEIHCDDGVTDAIADELNGDFAQVQYNIEGRANFGGGALELTREELAKMRIASISREAGGTSFTGREWQAPEAALRELVNHRRRRAKSA